MTKIAIVNTSSLAKYSDLLQELESIGEVDILKVDNDLSASDLGFRLKDYEHIILGSTPNISKNVLRKCTNLKHISRQGIGYDNIDVESAKSLGIKVSNIPSYVEKEDVSEHALALLLMVSKNIEVASKAVQNKEWTVNRERFFGVRLYKKTIGLIGFGNIGKSFAKKVKAAFDSEILVYDPYLTKEEIAKFGAIKVDLDELLRQSYAISLHIPSTPETYHMIGERELNLMKETSILINTSRGDLVDENAVSEAVKNNIIHSYATDVVEHEPIQDNNPLLSVEGIIITPHIAVYNKECNYDMSAVMVKNVSEVHKGLVLENWVNK